MNYCGHTRNWHSIILKLAPFCGNKPRLEKGLHGCNVDRTLEFCFQCECGIETYCFETEQELLTFWNNRKYE